MEREYIYRSSKGPVRKPSRHNRPPWPLWTLTGLVVLAIVILLVVLFTRKGSGPSEEDSSQLPAAARSSSASFSEGEPTPSPTPFTPAQQTAPDAAPEDLGGLMVVEGAAYEYFPFSTETANSYISAVAAAGDALSGTAQLYHLVAPSSMDVLLPESYLSEHQIDSADQRKAIETYIYPSVTSMSSSVKTVSVFDALLQRCDQYLYFRTDRTWTQRGAYYAYVEFCRAKGIEPVQLDQLEKKEYEGFMGGLSAQAGEDRLTADTVEAFLPAGNTSLSFTTSEGDTNDGWQVISDGSDYSSSLLYLIFAAGDQPYKVLENQDITDGSACVVVQDSYGNFFIPFLTQHYQHVYVVDYRYYEGSVPQLASDKGASDVIILNQVMAVSSEDAVSSLQDLF